MYSDVGGESMQFPALYKDKPEKKAMNFLPGHPRLGRAAPEVSQLGVPGA
jgi:hypothetical protein